MIATGTHRMGPQGRNAKRRLQLIAKMAVFAPVAATVVVSVPSLAAAAHSSETPYEFPGVGSSINMRYDAYLPIMRASAAALPGHEHLTEPEAAKLAGIWWKGYREGSLLPLSQIRYDESVFEGATGQILRTSVKIDRTLRIAASREAAKGDFGRAAADAQASMEVSRPLKYTDSLTLSLADAAARRALNTLAWLSPKLSRTERAAALQGIDAIRPDGPALESLVSGLYDLYIEEPAPNRQPVAGLPSLGSLRESKSPAQMRKALEGVKVGLETMDTKYPGDPLLGILHRTVMNEIATQSVWDRTEQSLTEPVSGR